MDPVVRCADYWLALSDGGRSVLVTARDLAGRTQGLVNTQFTDLASVRLVHWDVVAASDPARPPAGNQPGSWVFSADEIGTLEVVAEQVGQG